MKLSQAEEMAKDLMHKHGLTDKGWVFKWHASERAFGTCSYASKTIYLSMEFTRLNIEAEVKDTILHEIAHAIAGYEAGHGKEWKKICVEIGCRPNATFKDDLAFNSASRYRAVCECCSKEYKSPNKLPFYCFCQTDKKPKIYLNFSDRKYAE